MQTQAIPDSSNTTAHAHRQQVAAQPVPQPVSGSKDTVGDPSPARILTDAFEDLRRRMATLEGRIIEGSNNGEVARIAQMLERVESQLQEGSNGSKAMSKKAPGMRLIGLVTLIAFGTGIIVADHAPELRAGSEQVRLSAATFWQAASERIGDLRTQ